MNAILGNIELLLDGSAGPLSARARACVVDIQDAGQSLCRQHQTLLLLVQALSVERLPATRQVDLHLTLQQVLRETDRVGQPGPLTSIPPIGAFWVQGDPYWLEVLARTLVALGRQETAAPGPVHFDCSKDGRLRLRCPGFDPARLEATGLALVERIMALHGGGTDRISGTGIELIFRIEPAPPGRPRDDSHPRRSAPSRA